MSRRARLRLQVQRYGVLGFAVRVATEVRREAYRRLRMRRARDFDRRVGVDTAGVVHPDDYPMRARTIGAVHYQPVDRRLFDTAIERLGIRCAEFTFVDLGAGKGKALLLAAEQGFRRIIGVELSASLVSSARVNVERAGMSTGIELLCENAANYQLPAEPLLVFMFNPFGAQTMAAVAANIGARSRDSADSPVLVLYIGPVHVAILAEAPFLRPLWQDGLCAAFEASGPTAG